MKTPKHLYTIGYEGLSLQAFIKRLHDNGVHTLVDVRELPLSRKRGFSKRALADALAVHGIAYAHMPTLGCPKAIRERYKVNSDWARYTRDLKKYLATQQAAVEEFAKISRATIAALMCFEADFTQCHRTYVARAAAVAGASGVVHITARTTTPELARRVAA